MPKKRSRASYNTSRLRNQQNNSEFQDLDDNWNPHLCFDSLKTSIQAEEELKDEMEKLDMEEWDSQWDNELKLNTEGLQVKIANQAKLLGDDPRDEDWVPPKLRARKGNRNRKVSYLKNKF